MPRYAQQTPGASWRTKALAVAGAAAALTLLAAVAGHVFVRAPDAKPQASSGSATDPRTANGAASAVAAWLSFNDSPKELLDREHRKSTVERFASMSARARLAEDLDDAARRLRANLAGPPATVRGTPLGYRVAAFSPTRSVVLVWEVVLRGGLNLTPTALVAESRITLVWEDAWKIDRVAVKADPVNAWSADDLATADERFGSFRHVP